MRKKLFGELVESIKEAGRIHRGEIPPSRKFVFEPMDIKGILLSPTFHRAFDRGLIFLDEEYFMRVNEKKVSRLVNEDLYDGIEGLRSFLDKRIQLPFDKNQWSDTKNIERALIVRRIRGFLTTRSTNRSGNRS